MFDRVLVVCVGNICRSPVGQFLLQKMLPEKNVSSAGLAALEGHDMDPNARAVAAAHGLDCPTHKARQLTPELCHQADLILVMETTHREALGHICPESRGKVFLFGGPLNGMEIGDPYRQGREVFEHVHEKIERAAVSWAKKLA